MKNTLKPIFIEFTMKNTLKTMFVGLQWKILWKLFIGFTMRNALKTILKGFRNEKYFANLIYWVCEIKNTLKIIFIGFEKWKIFWKPYLLGLQWKLLWKSYLLGLQWKILWKPNLLGLRNEKYFENHIYWVWEMLWKPYLLCLRNEKSFEKPIYWVWEMKNTLKTLFIGFKVLKMKIMESLLFCFSHKAITQKDMTSRWFGLSWSKNTTCILL